MANEATVLVVDDEEVLRNAIIFQFKREGFNVLSASNGKEAFELIKTNKIDAVISDIQMPGGNGVELLKDVKEYDAEIPVMVFITAFADITEQEAYHLGANAIFTKPFDRKSLVKCIKDSIVFKGRTWKAELPAPEAKAVVESLFPVTVGRGGAFIETDVFQLALGEAVNFNLKAKLDEKEVSLHGIGKIRWIRQATETLPSGVGIEFLSVEKGDIENYEAWLNKHNVKVYIPNG